ncbi:MAG: hypothetical protein WB994_00920, partial [Candidatus Acidiferrum sp.]
ILILHEGVIVECGAPEAIFNSPQHAYTRRLVAALPTVPVRKTLDAGDPQDAERSLIEMTSH